MHTECRDAACCYRCNICLSVCTQPCAIQKRLNRSDAVWVVDSRGPKKPCTSGGAASTDEGASLGCLQLYVPSSKFLDHLLMLNFGHSVLLLVETTVII